jgi:hypothetical protein
MLLDGFEAPSASACTLAKAEDRKGRRPYLSPPNQVLGQHDHGKSALREGTSHYLVPPSRAVFGTGGRASGKRHAPQTTCAIYDMSHLHAPSLHLAAQYEAPHTTWACAWQQAPRAAKPQVLRPLVGLSIVGLGLLHPQ